jgi:hypothetical protein
MRKEVSEEDLLNIFVEEMENRGQNHKMVRLDINDSLLGRINSAKGTAISLEQLYKMADRCLANKWIEHTIIGGGKYSQLSITATGAGIVRTRRREEQAKSQRTLWKKISDGVEDHKGLFVALGAAIALLTFLLTFFKK